MKKKEHFIGLFILGVMLFSYPAINIFEFYLSWYFYAAWLGFIVLALRISLMKGNV